MDIKRAKHEIINTVRAYLEKDAYGYPRIAEIRQRPILLMGPPGIGKTAIIEQAAMECGIGLVSYTMTHHTRQSALGLPFIREQEYNGKKYSVTEYTMSEIIASVYEWIKQTELTEGILFIDEINCVSETLAPVMLQFLQRKSFGNAKVPAGWVIAAAGNPPEYNRSVRDFDVVTLDRVKLINVDSDYKVWKEYALKQGIHSSVISYLDIKPQNFYKMETSVDGRKFVTGRGWEDLSDLIKTYEYLDIPVDEQVVLQYIQHPKTASDFANYLSLYYKYEENYNIESILSGQYEKNNIMSKIKNSGFDERISVVSLILSGLDRTFRESWNSDRKTDTVFSVLKNYQQNRSEEDFVNQFHVLVKMKYSEFERKEQAGLLSEVEIKYFKDALAILEDMWLKLAKSQSMLHDKEQAVDLLREKFAVMTKERKEIAESGKSRLEHSFMFLEEVFGNEAELLLFVTELAAGFYSLAFIEENGCDRFYRLNRSLMKDSIRDGIRKELETRI